MGISYRHVSRLKKRILGKDATKLNLLKAKSELRISKESEVWILYKDNVIYETYLSGDNEDLNKQNKEEQILGLKKYVPEFKICDTSNSNNL